MKKLLKSLVLFAAAAMALTSCENEAINEGIETNDTYTMTFTAGAPESRTSVAIDGATATYSWSADDKVGFIQSTVVGETPKINKKNSKTISIDGNTATFTTLFDSVDGATSFDYGAFYPGESWVSNTSFAEVIVKIPASQNYTENSFDPLADLMMAKPILGVTEKDGHGGNLEFARLAAIGKMTLSGVRDGEVIKRVQFSINDAVLSGQVTLDFENITAEYATEGDNYIEVEGDNVGNEIFFTCFPGAYTGTYTIDVETDKAFYQKVDEFTKEFTLTAGNILAFNASVNWVEDKATDKVYTKITNANLADYSGEYLLVCESKNIAFDGSGTTSAALDKDNNTFSVEIVDGTITGDYTTKSFTIAKVDGGYSVLAAGGLYIGNGGTSNGMSENATYSASTYLNTIENCVLKGKGGLAMQVYSSGSNNRFRYYTSGKIAVSLYRLNGTGSDVEGGETPEPEPEVTLTTGSGEGTEASPYDVTRALEAIEKGHSSISSACVRGIISQITEISTQHGNATYYISVDGSTNNQLQVYRGKGLNGDSFTSEDALHTGDVVVVKGELKDYNGTKEFNTGSQIVSLECGHAAAITISVENQNIANTEVDGTVPVTVTNGEGYGFEATTTAEWLAVEWVDGGVYYVAEANTGAERNATVSIYATDGENEKTVEFTITQAGESTSGESATYTESFSGITTQKTSYTEALSYTSTNVQIGGSYIVWSGLCAQYVGNSGKAAVAFGKNTGSYIQTTVADGLTSLTINYILPFKDTQVNFVLNVNGEDVETKNVTGLSGAGATGSVEFTGLNYSGETIIKIHQGSVQTRSGIASIVWTNNN